MIRILFCLFLACSLLGHRGWAQTYRTAAGVRFGTEIGLSIQQRLWETGTIEGIVTSNKNRWQAQALVQYHRRVIGRRINSYFGVGPHYGELINGGSYAGITPIFGFEMTFFGLNLSYDYKPSFNVFHGSALLYHDTGLTVRVILLKQKRNGVLRDLF